MGDVRQLGLAFGAGHLDLRILNRQEEERLFEAIGNRSHLYYDFSVFLADTGGRTGEAVAVKWSDVNGGMVTFRQSKLAEERSLPMTERARRSVRRMAENARGPYSSIRLYDYRSVWNDAKQEVGLTEPRIVPSILRHTCAYRLIHGGLDLQLVQRWLGHKSLAMTMRYAHSIDGDLQCCTQALERSIPQPV